MTALDARPFAQVRTYHPRRGRQGVRRREALHRLWPRFGVGLGPTPLAPAALSGRWAPMVLEIGSGTGRTTTEHEQRAAGAGRTSVDLVLRRPTARR